jgi:DNA helicase-4
MKRCPICGYPLQLRYKKAYGLRLWICSNEPEVCDFITNDLKGNEMSIIKCDQCKDGYLIVKEGKKKNGETNERYSFLGCTNYKQDGRGCNRMMTYKQYRALINSAGSFNQ